MTPTQIRASWYYGGRTALGAPGVGPSPSPFGLFLARSLPEAAPPVEDRVDSIPLRPSLSPWRAFRTRLWASPFWDLGVSTHLLSSPPSGRVPSTLLFGLGRHPFLQTVISSALLETQAELSPPSRFVWLLGESTEAGAAPWPRRRRFPFCFFQRVFCQFEQFLLQGSALLIFSIGHIASRALGRGTAICFHELCCLGVVPQGARDLLMAFCISGFDATASCISGAISGYFWLLYSLFLPLFPVFCSSPGLLYSEVMTSHNSLFRIKHFRYNKNIFFRRCLHLSSGAAHFFILATAWHPGYSWEPPGQVAVLGFFWFIFLLFLAPVPFSSQLSSSSPGLKLEHATTAWGWRIFWREAGEPWQTSRESVSGGFFLEPSPSSLPFSCLTNSGLKGDFWAALLTSGCLFGFSGLFQFTIFRWLWPPAPAWPVVTHQLTGCPSLSSFLTWDNAVRLSSYPLTISASQIEHFLKSLPHMKLGPLG